MATSRTGTAEYLQWRRRVLARDRAAGITHCRCTEACRHHHNAPCGVELDYDRSRQPNSAEPDHITAHAHGGANTLDNGRTICRRCNQARGKGKAAQKQRPKVTSSPIW